jgi:hypothetical protein
MRRRKLHNLIIKTITVVALIVALIGICCIDSDGYVALIATTISFGWLALFCIANER